MTTNKQLVIVTADTINSEYRKAKLSMVDSANHIIRCGKLLAEKKEELGHGNFTPWVEAECEFTRRTASSMMKAASNGKLASHLTEDDAIAISRDTWGHTNETRHNILTGNYEWYTPEIYVEASREVMGSIDTDPASSAIANKIVEAEQFYTQKQNGLTKKWAGNVFLNPPYKQPEVSEFTNKLSNDYMVGEINQAILLTNNSTDTTWWQDAAQNAAVICFTSGRISFNNKEGEQMNSPTTGQTFMYFGNRIEKFKKVFSDIGWCSM
jgi:ParB family chromosome partitioning protein